MSGLQIFGLLYLIIIIICFFEAYFYTTLDSESERFLEEREKNRKNEHKSNN